MTQMENNVLPPTHQEYGGIKGGKKMSEEEVLTMMEYAMKHTQNGENIIVHDASHGTKSSKPNVIYIEKQDDFNVIWFEDRQKSCIPWQEAARRLHLMRWVKEKFYEVWGITGGI
jgi:DUF2075 family protein